MSAERFEYHPLNGDSQPKILPVGRIEVSAERFELSTNGLKGRCSAIELRARKRADCILSCESRGVNVIDHRLPSSMRWRNNG